ncbi:putative transcriptional regulatory protein [Canna indica]|uniref:Transcriptional regulatory protein n=1 Tax=Canna indica TaxID=4628 RepID=A0AAQ3QIX7_9LILI|nr:putative transcriptional regulatory protein [Canna indica]
MASSARAFGAVIYRVSLSHGLSSLRSPLTLEKVGFLGAKLPSVPSNAGHYTQNVRKIWSSRPVCMGRRSCKIAGRKESQNLKKMKRNSKVGKEIAAAIQKGGPNPNSNILLAAALQKARDLEVPKEIVERNIKKASEKGQEAFIEKFYEVYGFGGVGMVVEVLTDKVTRSVASVRGVAKDCGAKLADPGSILFKFRRARVVNIKANAANKDQLLTIALDSGAEDVIEPAEYEDDSEEDRSDRYYKIVTSSENYSVIISKLQEGVAFEPDNGFELLPLNPIEVDDEAVELNKDLMSKLLELDDVDAVYSDQK